MKRIIIFSLIVNLFFAILFLFHVITDTNENQIIKIPYEADDIQTVPEKFKSPQINI